MDVREDGRKEIIAIENGYRESTESWASLLRNLAITRPNQVWSADITYIPMLHGFMYLVAIIDWYSRYVVAWRLSNTLDELFCPEALGQALAHRQPDLFNTDQGTQFTALAFTSRLEAAGIRISMDGRERALGNVFIERLWRSVKHEHVYLECLRDGCAVGKGPGRLLPVLQPGAPASELILPGSRTGAFRRLQPPRTGIGVSFLLAVSWS